MALVSFYSCTNVLWNATEMEPTGLLKNYSGNPNNMLKNHNYFKKYLMNSASCPDTLLFAYEFSIRCCPSINFSMNEQINFIFAGLSYFNSILLISRYKSQEPQMTQAVLKLLIFDRNVWWVHYTWDVEEYLVSPLFFIRQSHLKVLQRTFIQ